MTTGRLTSLPSSIQALVEAPVEWARPDVDKILALLQRRALEVGPITVLPGFTARERLFKRTLDLIITSLVLILVSPVLVATAVWILLESGRPVIVRLPRVGEGGHIFQMLKFRTMSAEGERRREERPTGFPDRRRTSKTAADPRITRVGRFLRRCSLDELPQLINVLKGDMSLVGPRPEQPHLAVFYQDWQRERWCVPQGITGLWQIRGRSLRPLQRNVEDDIEYVRNYSIWLDVRILLRTLIPVIRGTGAF